jgi:hypothetical protein
MNPLHWIRWKLLIVLAVVFGGVGAFGLGPLAKVGINRFGAAGYGANWQVKGVAFNPVTGRLTLVGLEVTECSQAGSAPLPHGISDVADSAARGRILTSDTVVFDLDMSELMRRRFYGAAQVHAAKVALERRADGSMNIDFGPPQPLGETVDTDWWCEAQKLIQKLQRWNDERRELAEKIPDGVQEKLGEKANGTTEPKKSRFKVDYTRRVTYPFQQSARFVATKLVADGVEIAFQDRSPGGQSRPPIPPLENGKIQLENLSDRPTVFTEPVRWTISGEMAGAPIELVGTLDERQVSSGGPVTGGSSLQFKFLADQLPVAVAHFFAGESLPLRFDSGTFKLAATATIADWNVLDVRPVLGFHNATVSPRPGARSIAGVSPDLFCRAFNEVGTFEINDMRVAGTVTSPDVEIGQTLTGLVKSGGKAIARKQMDKAVQKGTEKLNQELDRELGKLGANDSLSPEVGRTVDAVKKGLSDRLKGIPVGERPKKGTTKK